MHVIAAKAIAFTEASQAEFKNYIIQVIKNSRILARQLIRRGYNILTGGTDNHMVLVDLRKKHFKGNIAEKSLESIGIICNKNMIPFDQSNPVITSGLRFGTSAITTVGFKEKKTIQSANIIADLLDDIKDNNNKSNTISFKKRVNSIIQFK